MGRFLDDVPFSGIIRIRDMMYSVDRPFRLDQGDVSFDAPDSVKAALVAGVDDNRTHYVQTTGIPPLLELLAEKLRQRTTAFRSAAPTRSWSRPAAFTASTPPARDCSSRATRCSCPIRSGRRRRATSRARTRCRCRIRCTNRSGWRPDRRRDAPADHAEDARDLRQLAQQPDRRRAHARRSRGDRRARDRARSLGDLRRSLRGRALRRPRAHQHRVAARHVRAHDSDLHVQQDLRDHRPAPRLHRRHRTRRSAIACARCSSTRCPTRRRSFSTAASARSSGSQEVVAEFRRELAARRDLFYDGHRDAAPRHLHRRAAGRRVLRVPEDRSGVEVAAAERAQRRCRGR